MAVDPDVLRAARGLIDQYGRQAALVAEQRAANLPGARPCAAAHTWRKIARMVRDIESGRIARPRGIRTHH